MYRYQVLQKPTPISTCFQLASTYLSASFLFRFSHSMTFPYIEDFKGCCCYDKPSSSKVNERCLYQPYFSWPFYCYTTCLCSKNRNFISGESKLGHTWCLPFEQFSFGKKLFLESECIPTHLPNLENIGASTISNTQRNGLNRKWFYGLALKSTIFVYKIRK